MFRCFRFVRKIVGLPGSSLRGGTVVELDPDSGTKPELGSGAVEVALSGMSGDIGTFYMSSSATVHELKIAVCNKTGVIPRCQRLVLDGRILEAWETLAAGSSESSEVSVLLVQVDKEQNFALASKGATVVGSYGQSKPLLCHDEAFPASEFGDLFEHTEETTAGVPSNMQLGSLFGRQLQRARGAWNGDCQQSTFLQNDGVLIIRLPENGVYLSKLGFTYSPWDRNYGRECRFCISEDGHNYAPVGSVRCQYVTERGDPGRYSVQTLFLELGDEFSAKRSRFVKWSFGREGSGRRLYFVYALGSP
eukprot:TRINITY_DN90578_c0_g1_i1.p1 TRINITY_DN90578_c0_g1~~TRINITY_DN90578_c0_g1_i1.p1  ORF type:complete len:319 (+),score=58.66 TRINITY_DN90578_c0_g1_i1:42-959(+)